MQSNIEIVQAYYLAVNSGLWDKVGQLLSDNFTLTGFLPETVDKKGALDMLAIFRGALPDLRHTVSNIYTQGSVVKLTSQSGGRHMKELDLSSVGAGVFPSSGRFVIFPSKEYEYTVKDGQITSEREVTPPSPNSGRIGILKTLGALLPA